MKLVRTCIIVEDVAKCRDFYKGILEIEPVIDMPSYVEFETVAGGLALFDAKEQEKLAPGTAKAGSNLCSMLEFEVEDLDNQYKRIKPLVVDWVKLPTTQQWGTRSVYFRDPEGNLVNFFARTKS